MLNRVRFILYYMLGWIAFSELARVFFILYQWEYAKETPVRLLLSSCWYGLQMDLAVAAYITVLLILLMIAGLFIPACNGRKTLVTFTFIFAVLQLLVIGADAGIYEAWGTRIDSTPLRYLSNPREMWASVSHLPLFWIGLGFLLICYLLFRLIRTLISKCMFLLQPVQRRAAQAGMLILALALMAIPIRGGFQLQPLNQSTVYFCNNQFANNAAINASWNFLHSVYEISRVKSNTYLCMPDAEAQGIMDSLYQKSDSTTPVLRSGIKDPNIVFIVWESFTEKALHVKIGGRSITPGFEKLQQEGIYFSNCYSTGDRTDKGIGGLFSAYPSMPKMAIVKYPEKTASLPGLGKLLAARNYHSRFYYGGEPEFANIKSFMMAQQFLDITSKGSFSDKDMNSKWGAHDGIVYKRILHELPSLKEPYFLSWLTLTSHEPFETPVPSVFEGTDVSTKFLNSLHYSDSCVYAFIDSLKQLPSWKNTLVLISADHGHYEPVTGKRADNYHIPVLWLGGALQQQGIVINKTVSQLDMPVSIAAQLGLDHSGMRFGQNIFDPATKPWAMFVFNDGIGYVTDSSRLMYDNAGKRLVFEEGRTGPAQERTAKALMQVIYADFLKR